MRQNIATKTIIRDYYRYRRMHFLSSCECFFSHLHSRLQTTVTTVTDVCTVIVIFYSIETKSSDRNWMFLISTHTLEQRLGLLQLQTYVSMYYIIFLIFYQTETRGRRQKLWTFLMSIVDQTRVTTTYAYLIHLRPKVATETVNVSHLHRLGLLPVTDAEENNRDVITCSVLCLLVLTLYQIKSTARCDRINI